MFFHINNVSKTKVRVPITDFQVRSSTYFGLTAAHKLRAITESKACKLHAGEYEFGSLKVLKKSGYFSHVLNGGWVPKVGVYADTPLELLCVLRG